MARGGLHPIEDVKDKIRNYLADAGMDEVMTYTFINAGDFDKLGLPAEDSRRKAIQIINPISDDFRTMRTTLVPSLLNTTSYNPARQNDRVAVRSGPGVPAKALPLTEQPAEKTRLCLVLAGKRNELNWTESKDAVDFFDLKGVLEGVLEVLQASGLTYAKPEEKFLHPGKTAPCSTTLQEGCGLHGGSSIRKSGTVLASVRKPMCWRWT